MRMGTGTGMHEAERATVWRMGMKAEVGRRKRMQARVVKMGKRKTKRRRMMMSDDLGLCTALSALKFEIQIRHFHHHTKRHHPVQPLDTLRAHPHDSTNLAYLRCQPHPNARNKTRPKIADERGQGRQRRRRRRQLRS